jgi:hypothetical protein
MIMWLKFLLTLDTPVRGENDIHSGELGIEESINEGVLV